MMKKKPLVFLVCTGLGRINRGYETFARECFDTLKDSDEFDLYLVKGAGPRSKNEIVLPNFHRRGKVAMLIGKILKKDSYFIEQLSFVISMLPVIIFKKPSVIYYSDFSLGTFLWQFRRILKFRYQLLYSNGAPNGPPFIRMDHVQQLLPVHLKSALEGGSQPHTQTLLPYGFSFHKVEPQYDKDELRRKLQLPVKKKIILTVGALNIAQKRMDYIIQEMADMSDEYYLVMLGQKDDATVILENLAKEKISGRYEMKTVTPSELSEYYKASDIFALASLQEGFGRVFPEAMSFGLPCFVHDYTVVREVLGPFGQYFNALNTGALKEAIEEFESQQNFDKTAMIGYVYDTYSWEKLADQYKKMIINISAKSNLN